MLQILVRVMAVYLSVSPASALVKQYVGKGRSDAGSRSASCLISEDAAYNLSTQVGFAHEFGVSVAGHTRGISHFVANIVTAAQRAKAVTGGVAEWGTFAGKFLLSWILSARRTELHKGGIFVADAFENLVNILNNRQTSPGEGVISNASKSKSGHVVGGLGCQKCFEDQLEKFAPGASQNALIYTGDTLTLRPPMLDHLGVDAELRAISIDGDHSAKGTAIDLCLASRRVVPGAVIVLDDICHRTFGPPIIEGIAMFNEINGCCKLLGSDADDVHDRPFLVPFANIGCKLWLTTGDGNFASTYSDAIKTVFETFNLTDRYSLKVRNQPENLARAWLSGRHKTAQRPLLAQASHLLESQSYSPDLTSPPVLKLLSQAYEPDGCPEPAGPEPTEANLCMWHDKVLVSAHQAWLATHWC